MRPVDQAQLLRVRLENAAGNFVAVVEVLPLDPPAELVRWGDRHFSLHSQNPDVYRETFVVVSTTPAPGLAEQEVSTWGEIETVKKS